MSITVDGRTGEMWARSWLKRRGFEIFQPDWIARSPQGIHYAVEVKHQEPFIPPPFEGHGLPRWQVEARLRFQSETGVRAILLIREKGSERVFWQFIDVLDAGPFFDTSGYSPRRVYPVEAFNEG